MFVRDNGAGSWTLVCSVRCVDRFNEYEDKNGQRSDFAETPTGERSRCAHCHVCGGIVMAPEYCQLHGFHCPPHEWFETIVAAEFAVTFAQLTGDDFIPDAVWNVAEHMSLREAELCGFEVATILQPYDEDEEWPE